MEPIDVDEIQVLPEVLFYLVDILSVSRWQNDLLYPRSFRRKDLLLYTPDREMFPCLSLAYDALEKGNGLPAVMNAANEVAVESFLSGDLPFTGIADVVRAVMDDPPVFDDLSLSGILEGDRMARIAARKTIKHSEKIT